MKLGVFDPIYGGLAFEPMLDRIAALGLEAVELGCGNYPGDRHCRPPELLADTAACDLLEHAITSRGVEISALSCHGDPIDPDADRAARDDAVFRKIVRLAGRATARRGARPRGIGSPRAARPPDVRRGLSTTSPRHSRHARGGPTPTSCAALRRVTTAGRG